MKEKEYKKETASLLSKINSDKVLRYIYTFVKDVYEEVAEDETKSN